jgi:SAM-dependent methyltransferase
VYSLPTSNQLVGLVCPRCATDLDVQREQLQCTSCDASYRVIDGVPRLLERDFYWGEIEQMDARRLVEDATNLGWKAAVAGRFSEHDAAWLSILDWQRASWIPLLRLPKESVVLDVGSGYGAITHALAANFDEVHSIEAIPERVEFTNVRLRQEGFDNVRLVQGSALQLPYPPGSFDAIIVNGVLEWIGDWDLEGSPRSAQLRFLRRLHTLLKPSGRLLVGIENRFGYVSVGGTIDHSGLPYTNLLPRPLATAALRLFGHSHHRMKASPRSYRTYTYSERGFRKLFREADYEPDECYWAEPGYNLPYCLTPLTRQGVAEKLVQMQTEATAGGALSLAARVKRALANVGAFQRVVPEFVFILRKEGADAERWDDVLPSTLSDKPHFQLTTQKFGSKTTIRAYTDIHPGVILKCSTAAPRSKERIATEYMEMETIAEKLVALGSPSPFKVSTPLGSVMHGRQLITIESRAAGDQVAMLLFNLPRDQRLSFLQAQLPGLAEAASTIATLMRGKTNGASVESWIDQAMPLLGDVLEARAKALRNKYSVWSGHGDFNSENILLDAVTKTVTVIDWEYVRAGVPPLYDHFTLLFAMLTAVIPPDALAKEFDDLSLCQFYTAFFHDNEWSALFASCIARERDRLGIDRDRVWDMFVDFLILRIGYLVERKSAFSVSRAGFLEMIMPWENQFKL